MSNKKISLMSVIIISFIVLTGCENKSNSKKESTYNEPKTIKFVTEANNNHERLWYDVDVDPDSGLTKKSLVSKLIITNKGSFKIYHGLNLSLSDISQLSKEQIIKKAKVADKKEFDLEKNNTVTSLKENSNMNRSNTDGDYKSSAKYLLPKIQKISYSSPKYKRNKVLAEADGSGNKIISESINSSTIHFEPSDSSPLSDIKGKKITSLSTSYLKLGNLYTNTNILSKYYTGYIVGESDDSDFSDLSEVLLTDVKSAKVQTSFDSKNTKNIVIDE